MADIILPPGLRCARSSIRYVDNTGVTRGAYNGAVQTTRLGGSRVGASIDFTFHGRNSAQGKSERAQLRAFLMRLQGKSNRIYAGDDSGPLRGSFPASELLTNADFSGGTTGWSSDTNTTLSAADGVLRASFRTVNTGISVGAFQLPTVTAYVPYCVRSILMAGQGLSTKAFGPFASATNTSQSTSTDRGYRTAAIVAGSTTLSAYPLFADAGSGLLAGDYLSILFASAARCALVDGGANLAQRSEEYGNAYWTPTNATVSSDADTAPDGTATGDYLRDTAAVGQHYVNTTGTITVSSSAADYAFSVCVKAGNRGFCYLQIFEGTGNTAVTSYFDLANGIVGTSSVGSNWAAVRTFITAMGNGWYRCTVVGRKTNAATALSLRIGAASADNTSSYSGVDTQVAILLWRSTLSQSSVPSRLRQTTSAAAAAESQTGSSIHVKGLPASTSGLLLMGDWSEIDGQLKMTTADFNSDSAGLGQLQFSPPLYRACADNTPVIVNKPMGRFVLAGDASWLNEPGLLSSASIDLEEAYA